MSTQGVFAENLDLGNKAKDKSVRAAKDLQIEPLRRPSAGLDLMNLVQRIFLTQEPCRVVAFAGVGTSSEDPMICLETARILASSISEDVLIVDADLEHMGLLEDYSKMKERGLTTALQDSDSIRSHASKLKEANLYLMLPGPSVGRRLLTGSMRNFLGRAMKEFQYVLIHSPSLATSPDCVTLAQAADGMVLILEASKTRKAVAIKTVKELESAGATILGAVLGDTAQPIPSFIYDRL